MNRKLCESALFDVLDLAINDIAEEARSLLKDALERCGVHEYAGDDEKSAVNLWIGALGALICDVSGSALLLLSHGNRRAAAILNRSVFEYQLRLRYYRLKPSKALEAVKKMPERFRVIMRSDPTWRVGLDAAGIAETEAFLQTHERFSRENIKADLFKTVYGDDADAYYDGYYGKASGLVHGYETILRDVYRSNFNEEHDPHLDFEGKVWDANDAGHVLTYCLIEAVKTVLSFCDGDLTEVRGLSERWDRLRTAA